ncbi:hypothetical protein, partial [Sphingobium sp. YR768]|uniref:hypothetical protein n=1 Tax=Sphingobium sp. YR768 TaxID=1884365 RepID=UPI001C435BDE
RPLGVRQYKTIHTKPESHLTINGNPKSPQALEKDLGKVLDRMPCQETKLAIRYLNRWPPQVQKYVSGQAVFCPVSLKADTAGGGAIEAAKRVRNNLFHGGKHTPHSPPYRDENLIRCASQILNACLEADANLRNEFEHQVF